MVEMVNRIPMEMYLPKGWEKCLTFTNGLIKAAGVV